MTENSPLVTDLKPGKHAICACGQTANAPFCDGSHQGSGVTPLILDVDAERRYAWCRCRGSADIPACDGSHAKAT